MITNAADYYGLLYRIQDKNAPSLAVLLPSDENIYNIDLSTRTIEAPDFISVSQDHLAEIIYFKCPRYFENMDLASTVGVVEYINARGDAYIYAIPFYDVDTCSKYNPETGEEEDFILFPWVIDGGATAAAGTLTFAIRFYKLHQGGENVQYNLNLLPQTTKVLEGLSSKLDYTKYDSALTTYAEQALEYLKQASDIGVFWLDV